MGLIGATLVMNLMSKFRYIKLAIDYSVIDCMLTQEGTRVLE